MRIYPAAECEKTKPNEANLETAPAQLVSGRVPAVEQTAAGCCVCSRTSAECFRNMPGKARKNPYQSAVAISVSEGFGQDLGCGVAEVG